MKSDPDLDGLPAPLSCARGRRPRWPPSPNVFLSRPFAELEHSWGLEGWDDGFPLADWPLQIHEPEDTASMAARVTEADRPRTA